MNDPFRRVSLLRELIATVHLAWRLWFDPRVSAVAKLVPVGVLAYVISPIDLIPDVFVGFGQLDDLAIVLLGVRAFLALCPSALVQWHREQLAGRSAAQSQSAQTIEGTYRVIDE
ncbi:MAG: DUF1232 domain-containing protein [Chloroflexi bacterium]|nr:DUF1232 domain-containing protein [Chloroflexota bacterium]MBI3734831.1 DUF1232 domain-containing protein [Chloroflexota bacterium]